MVKLVYWQAVETGEPYFRWFDSGDLQSVECFSVLLTSPSRLRRFAIGSRHGDLPLSYYQPKTEFLRLFLQKPFFRTGPHRQSSPTAGMVKDVAARSAGGEADP